MSNINTNSLNVNYPVPGVNNNSQGFRDNFAAIKTNLDIASSEVSDIQNKAVFKSALANTTINNDMGNTLISNAATRGFRATTYNLGNALAGTVLIDVSLGTVQYGTVSENITLEFGNWAPTGTQSNVELQFSFSNTAASVTFPQEVIATNDNFGMTTLENYSNNGVLSRITVPYGVTQVDLKLSTIDCGNSIVIEPYNRPRIATQIHQRTPASTGFQGDVVGTVSVDPGIDQLTISNTTAVTNLITTTGNTIQLKTDMPVVFTGNTFGGILAGSTYYVRNVFSSTQFTIASTKGGANVSLTTSSGNMKIDPIQHAYVCVDDFNSTSYDKTVLATAIATDAITLNNTTNLVVNAPIVFSGNVYGGLQSNTVYYIKSIDTPNITVSFSKTAGIADSVVKLSTGPLTPNVTFTATAYIGNDIWRSIPLLPFGTDGMSQGNISSDLNVSGNASVSGYTSLGNTFIGNAVVSGNVSGNIQAYNLTVSNLANFTSLTQLKIAGGTNGYFLQTDGSGNLSWVVGTAVAASSTAAGANTQIQFNNSGSFGGSSSLTWNNTSNTLAIGNALTVTANTTVGNLTTSGNIVAGNITVSSGTITTPSILNGTSNVRIATNGNVTISVGSTPNVFIVTTTSANVSGNFRVTANANVGNIGATAGVFAGSLSGITTITANANITTTGSVISGQYLFSGVTTSITATGASQGTAVALTNGYNVVTIVTGTNHGVILPASVAGMRVMVRNDSGNTLYVYPPIGSNLNTLSVNSPLTIASISTNEFYCTSSTQWYSLI